MVPLARMVAGLLSDAFRLIVLLYARRERSAPKTWFSANSSLQYTERGIKPRRVDFAFRVSLVLLTKLFDWRDVVVILRPATIEETTRSALW